MHTKRLPVPDDVCRIRSPHRSLVSTIPVSPCLQPLKINGISTASSGQGVEGAERSGTRLRQAHELAGQARDVALTLQAIEMLVDFRDRPA